MNLKKVEIIGIIFTLILGSLLHFTYGWSSDSSMVALFSAVNESTWEHMKLLFFPYLVYGIFEYIILKYEYENIITAKCLGVISGMVLIPLLFYSYKAVFQQDNFVADISIFVISVIVSYAISYTLIKNNTCSFERICFFILLSITLAFFIFTFNPPKHFIFLDPVTGEYGIQVHNPLCRLSLSFHTFLFLA